MLVVCLVLLAACNNNHSEHHEETLTETEHEHEGIFFSAEQAARTDFAVETVEPGTFCEVIRTSGQILPAQGDEVTLVAPVSGIVSLGETRLTDGGAVKASQRLFYISSKNIASGDLVAKSTAAYRKARADYERAEQLLADRIVSQKEFDQIRLAYEQAKAEYDALAPAESAKGVAVSTPISGYVTSLSVGEGDYVETGQPLATISQTRRLMLRAELSQRYYNRLKGVRSANFTVPYDNKTYELGQLGGRLLSVGKASATGSALIPVTFEFDNNGAVVPGSYVEVYLLGAPVADAITLPLSALTEQQGLYYVYVQICDEEFERREVTPGADDGERVMILKGLEAGERVVTRGAVQVRMASASGTIPHGHSH